MLTIARVVSTPWLMGQPDKCEVKRAQTYAGQLASAPPIHEIGVRNAV